MKEVGNTIGIGKKTESLARDGVMSLVRMDLIGSTFSAGAAMVLAQMAGDAASDVVAQYLMTAPCSHIGHE